ncbi:MAG: HAD hydrolase-like protein, partial [Clostridia bacterium]|nr:HAD hydrolase-like protein [Clostridia bacterium]
TPFPEAEPLLRFIKEHGGKNYIYSHSGAIVKRMLGIWGWESLFDGIIDGTVKLPRKPAPDGVNLLCSTFGLDKASTVIVGDRSIDTDAGKNAGIDGILFDPEKYYDNIEVTYKVDSLLDIEKILLS